MFEYKDITKLRRPEGVDYTIELEKGTKPPFRPLYNLSASELKELREYIKTTLANS